MTYQHILHQRVIPLIFQLPISLGNIYFYSEPKHIFRHRYCHMFVGDQNNFCNKDTMSRLVIPNHMHLHWAQQSFLKIKNISKVSVNSKGITFTVSNFVIRHINVYLSLESVWLLLHTKNMQ